MPTPRRASKRQTEKIDTDEIIRGLVLRGDPIIAQNLGFLKNLSSKEIDDPMASVMDSLKEGLTEEDLKLNRNLENLINPKVEVHMTDEEIMNFLLSSRYSGKACAQIMDRNQWDENDRMLKEKEAKKKEKEEKIEVEKKKNDEKKDDRKRPADDVPNQGASTSASISSPPAPFGLVKPYKIPRKSK
ncbi:hypothetical protein GCK72_013301 [Caenorhabditis remanei]|uniref:Uncharacterized protein n=1 Tax=Caenorhabditis remanei TaxID=31234 RepID=A0A6A5GNP1_CAERE|nr:hypothetical protein GCK72_013301 [Caenorhabditis remanei]KAF1756847.1 hypothetical protein GCK72_013301 [Caenorhabditis remanei]